MCRLTVVDGSFLDLVSVCEDTYYMLECVW